MICGNRNYSSWSLRAWLCLRKAGVNPEVFVLPMDTPEFQARIAEHSPTRRVPVLWIGDESVWDSLAIAETVNERFADFTLWPKDPKLRALGRSMAAEMHSSFAALRHALPMNCRARQRQIIMTDDVQRDVDRLCELWQKAKMQSGSDSWLLGDFSIADAMFAPVALRFRAYALNLPQSAQEYVQHWLSDVDLQEWIALAEQEPWVIEHEEVGESVS
ncbi:MAG: glutathione S-transferase family protein [Congregibacter sp.]|nr:glutathione S-transferase family protein [Congregibacter sp.]